MRLLRQRCFIREAKRFIAQHHRHNKIPVGALFAMAAQLGAKRVGVVIVGRPVAQELQKREPETCEVTRCCTDGTHNACSFLYGCAVRAARELG